MKLYKKTTFKFKVKIKSMKIVK